MYKTLLALAVLCVSAPCFPQTPTTSAGAKTAASAPTAGSVPNAVAVPNYADEAAVVERDEVAYRFAADGTGSKRETTVLRVQSNAALQSFGVLSFPYASGNQHLEIVYARVRKADGTVVETPPSDAQDQPAQATQIAPMYSDLHLKQIPIRSLAVGDKLEFQVLLTMQQPEAAGEFWGAENFGAGIVYLSRTIELRVPKLKALTVYSPNHKPEISEVGGERVYRWAGSQLRSTAAKTDEDEPQDNKSPIAWTTFASWDAVGQWYRGVIAGRDTVTPAIKAKADELTANAKTDTDKVRALYEYVSTHNHYIGIDFGIGRYQPHPAAEVLTNQYGDCKDKHTLLAALLRAEGFQVSPALIGAGIAMNEKVPMPGAFNHVITVVNVGGEKVWLDATTEVAPYRALLAMLRDKQALVIPALGAAELEKTPAQLPFPAVTRFEAKADLDKTGSLKGHVEITMRGDDEIILRLAARQVARTQWDQLSQAYFGASGWSGTTSATLFDSPEDTSVPLRFRYDVSQSPYGDWEHYRIGSLLPNTNLPSIDAKKPPKQDIDLGTPHTRIAETIIHLPEGYGAELPDAIHLKTAFATYDKTYSLKDGSLVSESRLENLTDKVAAADWKDYKKFLDDIGDEPWIQLTAKESILGMKGPPVEGENNPAAAELVRQAQTALQARDKDLARKKLDEAATINAKQRYLWSQTGYLAALDNAFDVAAADYQRELKQYPDESTVYPALIEAQGRIGKKAEQRESLLAYAKAVPDKDSVILWVAGRLLATDNVADAVEVYRAGAKTLPENKLIQVELGSALLRAGKADEAIAEEKAALDGSTDADVLNDGAYVLVSAHAELPLAETDARKAVDLLEAESKQTALESVNARSFRRTNLLLAAWDTLGWVYFTEGKIDLAEEYVRAAWSSAAHAETGLHLGEIYEKRGTQIQAMQIYELALNGRNESSATPVLADLHARVDALKKLGIGSQYPHPDSVLQQQRTFRIPRPNDLKGSAIFLVQVSADKTEKVQMISGDEALRSRSEALAQLDLKLDVPAESHALLLRSAVLFCSTEKTCEFVLTPPESANVK